MPSRRGSGLPIAPREDEVCEVGVARARMDANNKAVTALRPYEVVRADDAMPRFGLLHPVNLIPIPVFALFIIGRNAGFVANVPWWLLLGSLAAAQIGSSAFAITFPPGSSRAKPLLHLALEMTLIGIVIYVTGWGAVLGVGLIFCAAGHMGVDGSRVGVPAIAFSALTIIVGETFVQLGWVKSLVAQPEGHGLALLEIVGVGAVIWMLMYTQRVKEGVELDLRRSEERLGALVQHASDAIVVMDASGRFLYASPATERLLGYAPHTLERWDTQLVHPDYVHYALAIFDDVLSRPEGLSWLELPLLHTDGDYRWFEIGMTNLLDNPAVGGLVCNMRDVTDRRHAQEQLRFQAHHDALTKLPNRWFFLEQLERAQHAAATADRYVGVLFVDVDHFKLVNDSLGHEIGDTMLTLIAERITSCMRPGDTVARFGGDEFTVLLADLADPQPVVHVAQRITASLAEPLYVDGRELFVSASVGIAISHGEDERAADVLHNADIAMYVAKEKGRGRFEMFDASFTPDVIERLEIQADLKRALDKGELIVQFQPEVSLSTGRVSTAEALVRWQHPTRGLLEPDSFIPLAEQSDLIVGIDRFVMREACHWARRWSTLRASDDRFVVSVNVSPRFMREAGMVDDITAILGETGVDPRSIQIEITERSALTDLAATCSQLHELRSLGVKVAVDDFGTGYSALSYLKQLPIDVLKLDKSFVDAIDVGATDVAIVQAIVTMGHALGVKVTAEGVERREQALRLRDLGCDTAMGWLWARALPPEQLAAVAEAGFAVDGSTDVADVVPLRARGHATA